MAYGHHIHVVSCLGYPKRFSLSFPLWCEGAMAQ
jgi:hypothetical protein